MARRNEHIIVGEYYLCPSSWNSTLGDRDGSHLIKVLAISDRSGEGASISAMILTPQINSRLRSKDSFTLSEYSAASLLHVDSIQNLVRGVRGRV